MADQSVRGRFVWHELVTPDANAAHAFYGKAIGWKSQPWEEDASYVMFAAPRGPIGATVGRDSVAPHWLPYIGTGDIEKTVELAKQKGGSVVTDVETLSTGSRHAVLQDPFGATFGVYESAGDYGKITPPKAGEHSWHELLSPDHEAAFEFYADLFGWQKVREHDMGPMGTYLIYGLNGEALGGMMKTMDSAQGTAWLSYVHVKDVNQTANKVKAAGGQIINGPMEVPGGDWIIAARDPQGAMFAAHASAANMKKPEKKPKQAKNRAGDQSRQLSLETESPPPVQEPETPAEEAPPADKPVEEPAREAPAKKAPARKAPAKEAPPAEAPSEEAPAKRAPAKKSPAKKAPGKKKAGQKKSDKKAPAKKAPAKKSTKRPAKKSDGKKSAGKKSGGAKKSSKKRPAAKGAGSRKSAARAGAKKGARKVATKSKTRSGGKKKAVKKPRKGK